MEQLLIESGEKVLTLFLIHDDAEGSVQHFMISEVTRASEAGIRVTGYLFYIDFRKNSFVRRPEPWSVVFSFSDTRLMQVALPHALNIDSLAFEGGPEPRLTADPQFSLKLKDLLPLSYRVNRQ